MGALAGKVKAAYAEVDTREIEVPEWDITLFVRPMTLRQFTEIEQAQGQGTVETLLATVRVRAKNEHGRPALDQIDIDALRTYGSDADDYGLSTLTRVVQEIMADQSGFSLDDEGIAETEKK